MMRGFVMYLLILCGMVQAQPADFPNIDFHRADSIAALYKGEDLRSLPILAHKLTAPLSAEVERFRAIYTWVCTNIEYDAGLYLRNKKKRKQLQHNSEALANWNAYIRLRGFKKLLTGQRTVCTGYAYLVRELAALADINCKIIDGYGRTISANIGAPGIPNHSWNAVQLNNKWYLCDPTWSSGSLDLQENNFIRNYDDNYFLADPELFIKNHYPLDTAWMLLKNKPSLSEFLQGPFIYKHAFKYHIIPLEPREMKIQFYKNEDITFLCKAPDSLKTDNIHFELIAGPNSQTATPTISRPQKGMLALTYRFARLGYYDVHIQVAEDDIVTYTIRIKKTRKNDD